MSQVSIFCITILGPGYLVTKMVLPQIWKVHIQQLILFSFQAQSRSYSGPVVETDYSDILKGTIGVRLISTMS